MEIFDRDAKIKQREISAQQEDYHLCEYVKEEVGWRTADRVFDIKRTFKNAVELGKLIYFLSGTQTRKLYLKILIQKSP